jgi:cytochrome c biogenesis protein CcdA
VNELAPLGFLSALLLGLSYGATACSIACVPLVGPALLGRGGGMLESWRMVAAFSLGRVSGYMGMASASALLGHWVAGLDVEWATRLLVGGGTMALGILVILRAGRGVACRSRPMPATEAVSIPVPSPRPRGTRRGLNLLGAYAMGLGMAFSPCAPLVTILLAAATAGSLAGGMLLGAGFGLGAALLPALLLGFGASALAHELRMRVGRWRGALERGAGLFLLALGALVALGRVSL